MPSYSLFKAVPLLQGQCVSFGDDGYDVHHFAETTHELHIQRPQTVGEHKVRSQFKEPFMSGIDVMKQDDH